MATDQCISHTWMFLSLKKKIIFKERGREGEKRGRETSMCERYIDRLPLTPPQLGT